MSVCCLGNLCGVCACCTLLWEQKQIWMLWCHQQSVFENQDSGKWDNRKSLLLPFWYLRVLWKQLHRSVCTCSETRSVVILRGSTATLCLSPRTFVWGQDKAILPVWGRWVQGGGGCMECRVVLCGMQEGWVTVSFDPRPCGTVH